MKKIVIGILAHVDAGKTTLTESMLYESGNIRKLGRVDNGNATLDTHSIEKKRGITIFSKQAILKTKDTSITILDTPGHTDFSAEMERALSVLDYAVLVINGADGVQSHTQTLWDLLELHKVPTFIYVNKMDMMSVDKEQVIAQMHKELSYNIIDYLGEDSKEKIAECNEKLLEKFLQGENYTDNDIAKAVVKREIFLSFYGSALKLKGVKELLIAMDRYTIQSPSDHEFKGMVYKITRDHRNVRLTNIKVISGTLKIKDILKATNEKIQQIRIYSGDGFEIKQEVEAGEVCAIMGLQKTYAGQGLGCNDIKAPVLKPILTYAIKILNNNDLYVLYEKLRILADEDPVLQLTWNENTRNITVGIMGDIQIEVLRTVIKERFSFDVDFDSGKIVYMETIEEAVVGVGHYEPLHHYAEVRLLLEPLKRGQGIVFDSKCKKEHLSSSQQSLVLTYLGEINHRGALTGSYITDMRITLVDGRANSKYTDSLDFRQATYRALQQGLRRAKTKLLEPYYSFELTVPSEMLGKTLHDLDIVFATIEAPVIENEIAKLKGKAPVRTLLNYAKDLANYTKGKGKINCEFLGYFDCKNTKSIVKEINFDSRM